MHAIKQFTLILAKYCKIVQSPFLYYGGKAWTGFVISTRFVHCTQYMTWKNVDHVHRIYSGTSELHEG